VDEHEYNETIRQIKHEEIRVLSDAFIQSATLRQRLDAQMLLDMIYDPLNAHSNHFVNLYAWEYASKSQARKMEFVLNTTVNILSAALSNPVAHGELVYALNRVKPALLVEFLGDSRPEVLALVEVLSRDASKITNSDLPVMKAAYQRLCTSDVEPSAAVVFKSDLDASIYQELKGAIMTAQALADALGAELPTVKDALGRLKTSGHVKNIRGPGRGYYRPDAPPNDLG
jgi:hypothetical protein